jgi:hypothetical protein
MATVRIEFEEITQGNGIVRIPRCCETPSPTLSARAHSGDTERESLYCQSCDTTWAELAWKKNG